MVRLSAGLAAVVVALSSITVVQAQKSYGPHVSDTEIKLAQSPLLRVPVSAFSAITKTEIACLAMIGRFRKDRR